MTPRTAWAALALAAIALTACDLLPGTAAEDAPIYPQMARAGLDVGVLVPGWTLPDTRALLCASETPERQLDDLASGNPRPDCLEFEVAQNGFDLRGVYSFRSESARRRQAFDRAQEWFFILFWDRQSTLDRIQVVVPGGPVEVR